MNFYILFIIYQIQSTTKCSMYEHLIVISFQFCLKHFHRKTHLDPIWMHQQILNTSDVDNNSDKRQHLCVIEQYTNSVEFTRIFENEKYKAESDEKKGNFLNAIHGFYSYSNNGGCFVIIVNEMLLRVRNIK